MASMKSTLEHIMAAKKAPSIPLPKSWTKHVRTAMLHVISLAQYATAYTRSWAADSTNARVRIKAESRAGVMARRSSLASVRSVNMGVLPWWNGSF